MPENINWNEGLAISSRSLCKQVKILKLIKSEWKRAYYYHPYINKKNHNKYKECMPKLHAIDQVEIFQ